MAKCIRQLFTFQSSRKWSMMRWMMTKKIIQMMVTPLAWKTMSSTVRCVTMFYRSCTWLFQNLGFETLRINLGWWAQWKMPRGQLEKKRHRTAHLPWSRPASSATTSPDPPLPPADLKNEDFQLTVVTNAKSEKMSASDIDGDGDDDEDAVSYTHLRAHET